MQTSKQPQTRLAKHLELPFDVLEPKDITDALIRTAILSRATEIQITVGDDYFKFEHDGAETRISDIESSWHREANENKLDFNAPYGLEICQSLLLGTVVSIASASEHVLLSRGLLVDDLAWPIEEIVAPNAMTFLIYGMQTPWALIGTKQEGQSAFIGCEIPISINGVQVERIQREGNPCFVDLGDVQVYIDLETAHNGFKCSIGGLVDTDKELGSIVFMKAGTQNATAKTEISEQSRKAWDSAARDAFVKAAPTAILQVEAQYGHEFVLKYYYRALLTFCPGMTPHFDSVSSDAVVLNGWEKNQAAESKKLLSRKLVSCFENPVFCDLPVADSASLIDHFVAFKFVSGFKGAFVPGGYSFPDNHWIRDTAISIGRGKIKVSAHGNVVTVNELLGGTVKLRFADSVKITLKTQLGTSMVSNVEDWVICSEERYPAPANDKELSFTPVIYVNRNCTELKYFDLPSREGDLSQLVQLLEEAQKHLDRLRNSGSAQNRDRN